MATCAKCGKDVKAFGVIDPATKQGTCEPCMSGVAPAPSPAPVAPPAASPPRPAVAPPAVTEKAPSPVAAKPEPKVEKRGVIGTVKDAVKGAVSKITKAVKKSDKKKR